eukprot:TRINITY_DN16524_c0_g1_i1.p1 TRINITY_DN16524_c0_g1~~TRINITY_DN16524_c0_g1_i1.p1  ORF type:complete len:187 (-),score=51.45 TRINITY_DN16524_c0_g1_i1:160-720(-)
MPLKEDKKPILPTVSEKVENPSGKAGKAPEFMMCGSSSKAPSKKKKSIFFDVVETCLMIISVVVLVVFIPTIIYNMGYRSGFNYSRDHIAQPVYKRNVFLASKIRELQAQIIDEKNLQIKLRDEQYKVDVLTQIINENLDEKTVEEIMGQKLLEPLQEASPVKREFQGYEVGEAMLYNPNDEVEQS